MRNQRQRVATMSALSTGVALDGRAYLDSLILHGVKLGLANIESLMSGSGSPHHRYPVVHVGGTNGKGSVAAFLDAILRSAGYRVGRFTSPHLLDVTERFLVNTRPMDEAALQENIAWFKEIAERSGFVPTYFEMNAAVAFRWFAQQSVDIALIEVGMGGRFDATNIVAPLVCAITNIALDHTQYLGDTLEKIAFEKAGILKPSTPAVIGPMAAGPLHVIDTQARRQSAPLFKSGREYQAVLGGTIWRPVLSYVSASCELRDMPLGLSGRHQAENAAVAVTLAMSLRNDFSRISEAAVRAGLSSASWPGRLERVLDKPPVIMDVAHNPAGCRSVADALEHCVTVFSVSADKDVAAMLDILGPISEPLILSEYTGGRCLPLNELRQAASRHPHLAVPNLASALEEGMRLAAPDRPLLVTGSIYAAGEARRLLVERYGARPVIF